MITLRPAFISPVPFSFIVHFSPLLTNALVHPLPFLIPSCCHGYLWRGGYAGVDMFLDSKGLPYCMSVATFSMLPFDFFSKLTFCRSPREENILGP
ncbi:hypothetical protein B9Z19DRAFT_1072502 [Tuber borchii]|uniref:Uncharacterized protein n=1 Tax=Tuber borchii TaxID=42251 RepID=A0A2T7A6Z3_TUBBO|nr:hypothetical protein B9Z19DRAFT_1072502 [Tuber borchii]